MNSSHPFRVWQAEFVTKGLANFGKLSDPHIDEVNTAILAEPDYAKRAKLTKDLAVYVTENCYRVLGPHPVQFQLWQPWLKNCHGAEHFNYWGRMCGTKYYWIDQDLKKEILGR